MSQVLDFRSVARVRNDIVRPALRGDETGEFWLEFARSEAPDDLTAPDPDTTPARVLREAFLVLAVAALFVVAVTWLVPGPVLP